MYREYDKKIKQDVIVVEEIDKCYSCIHKYDCPLISALTSATVDFTASEGYTIENCELYKC
jgi:hypothetical protein